MTEVRKELVGAALHPLNTPVVDKKTGTVIKGSGIISPKITVDLRSGSKTMFSAWCTPGLVG